VQDATRLSTRNVVPSASAPLSVTYTTLISQARPFLAIPRHTNSTHCPPTSWVGYQKMLRSITIPIPARQTATTQAAESFVSMTVDARALAIRRVAVASCTMCPCKARSRPMLLVHILSGWEIVSHGRIYLDRFGNARLIDCQESVPVK
jgi:hypothetical protein